MEANFLQDNLESISFDLFLGEDGMLEILVEFVNRSMKIKKALNDISTFKVCQFTFSVVRCAPQT